MSYERAGPEDIEAMSASVAKQKCVDRMATPCSSVDKPLTKDFISSGFLNPELIHARERIRILHFKGVPTIEIRPGPSR